METYRINAYLIGDSPRDGKNQVISGVFKYYPQTADVANPNQSKIKELKEFLLGNGIDYNNFKFVVLYSNGDKKIEKTNRSYILNNLTSDDFFLTSAEEKIRERIFFERFKKIGIFYTKIS